MIQPHCIERVQAQCSLISCALIMAVSTVLIVSGALPARIAVRESQSATARMPPRLSEGCPHSRSKPRVVEIQPADHRCRYRMQPALDRAGLRARHPCAIRHNSPGYNRPQQLRASGIFECLQPAAKGIDEAVPRRRIRKLAGDLIVQHIVNNVGDDGVCWVLLVDGDRAIFFSSADGSLSAPTRSIQPNIHR